MPKVQILNQQGENVGELELNEAIFGVDVNEHVVYEVVRNQLANKRQGTQSAKTRSEVRGGGKKPWRQKGTGHARQGSIRAVQWRGGGIAFGPVPRDYSKKMNRKERRLALKSAVASKIKDFVVVDELIAATPKTKDMVKILTALNLNNVNTLIIVKELDENLILASRNISNVLLIEASEINVLDLVAANKVLITKDALSSIEEVLK